jgi:hypothetical protein
VRDGGRDQHLFRAACQLVEEEGLFDHVRVHAHRAHRVPDLRSRQSGQRVVKSLLKSEKSVESLLESDRVACAW